MPAPGFHRTRERLLSGLQPQRELVITQSLQLTPGFFVIILHGVRDSPFRATGVEPVTHQRDGNVPQNGRYLRQRQGIASAQMGINQLIGIADTAIHHLCLHRCGRVEIQLLVGELDKRPLRHLLKQIRQRAVHVTPRAGCG